MADLEQVWDRIRQHAGTEFRTVNGLSFTYFVPGDFLRVTRDGAEINPSLSKTNFRKAAEQMPAPGPGALKDRQGSSYTWVILMDRRIRQNGLVRRRCHSGGQRSARGSRIRRLSELVIVVRLLRRYTRAGHPPEDQVTSSPRTDTSVRCLSIQRLNVSRGGGSPRTASCKARSSRRVNRSPSR